MATTQRPIAVLGAGSWGTALAIHLACHGQEAVRLWGKDSQSIAEMQQNRCNSRYLPDIKLPDNLVVFDTLAQLMDGVSDLLCVVPSHAFRQTMLACQPYVQADSRLLWATKGIDPHQCALLSDVAAEILGADVPLAVLSGPSFAGEVAAGLPTAVVVAGNDALFLADIVERFHRGTFRVYTSHDIVGVQIGSALKNIYAIAAGISDGLGFGSNARCALITRGLAEMMRLGVAMGGDEKTFMGLAGLGDLVLTCTDDQSRNRSFGLAIGRGQGIDEAERSIRQVVEGRTAVEYVGLLAQRYQIEMPIARILLTVIQEQLSPQQALQTLLARGAKAEF
ncbi:MAG: NAD(P)-dependent glycerol-3-phosphate dehydrogenase [Gammaproteobacteria bacterium]|nr:NAD(P)-dependent glycerol-3-phosphate dehydrogenase [Gammaproteobacteria bacterium]